MRFHRIVALVAPFVALSSAGAQLGSNIIVNPGAESGTTAWTTTQGAPTAGAYGVGAFPSTTDPGPAARGADFFYGGTAPLSEMTQTASLNFASGMIGSGTAGFTASGYFGGYASQGDNAVLFIDFLNGGNTISTVSVGGVTPADRGNNTGLLFRSIDGTIPVGATDARFRVVMTRLEGSDNDGYSDNLSFVVSQNVVATPEPSSMALLGTGLVALVPIVRRRRR